MPGIQLFVHSVKQDYCCSRLVEEPTAGEGLAGRQEVLYTLPRGASWAQAYLAGHKKAVNHMGCTDIE